jgi:hypothetical protein
MHRHAVIPSHLHRRSRKVSNTDRMEQPRSLRRRVAEGLVDEALADTRVVTINGARQTGKSTLAKLTAARRPGTVVRLLDDASTYRAAVDDPAGFVDHDGLMVIDEIQTAPELFSAIKVAVDTDPGPAASSLPARLAFSPFAGSLTRCRVAWRSLSSGHSPRARSTARTTLSWRPRSGWDRGVRLSEGWAISGCSGHAVRPRSGMLAGW